MTPYKLPSIKMLVLLPMMCWTLSGQAQSLEIDNEGFETFQHADGDTVYTMKKYYICFLKKGPAERPEGEQMNALQMAHLEHMSQLAEKGKICMSGPFADDSDLRGIVIYVVTTMEEAVSYAESDPMVKAGMLSADVRPWWGAKGSTLR